MNVTFALPVILESLSLSVEEDIIIILSATSKLSIDYSGFKLHSVYLHFSVNLRIKKLVSKMIFFTKMYLFNMK